MTALSPNTATGGPSNSRDTLLAAAITSQIAGLIMAVVIMIVFTVFLGKGPLYPVQVIGSVAFGESALQGINFAAILAGLVFHQALALAWGLVYGVAAAMTHIQTVKQAALLGLIVAAASMIDTYLIVPVVMNSLHGVDIWNREVPIFWNWAAHAVLGLSFGFYPAVLAKISRAYR
jgi:hypothetical protein